MTSEDKKVEEILSSIRTIISEDMKEGSAPIRMRPSTEASMKPSEPVIELTQMVEKDGSIINLKEPGSTSFSHGPTLRATAPLEPTSVMSSQREEPRINEALISSRAAEEFTKAFHSLESTIRNPTPPASTSTMIQASADLSQMTLEGIVHQMLQPLLKDWLDRHLPSLVKLLVSEQIEKILQNKQQ